MRENWRSLCLTTLILLSIAFLVHTFVNQGVKLAYQSDNALVSLRKKPPVIVEPITDEEYYIVLVVIGILVLLGGIFSGLTIGLMSLDSTNLAILRRSGTETQKRWVARIEPIRNNAHLLLVTLLLSNTIVNETLPVLFHYVDWDGYQAVLISTFLIVVFGEIIPQAVCTRYSLAIGAFFAYPVRVLIVLMWILAYPIAKLLDWILGSKHGFTYRRAELKELVAMHGEDQEGPLNQDEVSIVKAVLELRDKSVTNVMTTLEHVYMLPLEAKLDRDTMKSLIQAGHSRVPVFNGERQNVVGVVLVKQLVLYDPAESVPVAGIKIRRLPRVRVDTPLFEILHVFQAGGSHMAVVVDEVDTAAGIHAGLVIETASPLTAAGSPQTPGGMRRYKTLGIVTLEDVIEELIGTEIIDETDIFINVETGQKVRRTHREVKSRTSSAAALLDSRTPSLFGLLTPRMSGDDEEREPLLRDAAQRNGRQQSKEPNRIMEEANRILTKTAARSHMPAAPELRSPLLVARSRQGSNTGSNTSSKLARKARRDKVEYTAGRLASHVEQHPFGTPHSLPNAIGSLNGLHHGVPANVSSVFSTSINNAAASGSGSSLQQQPGTTTSNKPDNANGDEGVFGVNGINTSFESDSDSDSSGLSVLSSSRKSKFIQVAEDQDGFLIDGIHQLRDYSLDTQTKDDKASGITVNPVGDDLSERLSPVAIVGGQYCVDIKLPPDYPYKPPKMKFDTKIYHPNISSQTGAICLDILKDSWSPVITLKTALISLQSLLCDAAPDDPQDAVVAAQYKTDRKMFDAVARQWAIQYASSTAPSFGQPIIEDDVMVGVDAAIHARILSMGFDRIQVAKALKKEKNDEQRAIDALLNGTVL
ncbi:hypothetical protein SmJEL517_g04946 [Synchytrium microbalum]|uniref:Uncharacterized protein n=1 Tax=Synchytrium microbalum TaxID=1806994 RepID=A0A507BRR5_9FUNG|nr:uncharacterized protein SmJEL517_g04946 [Synchytrium microbalum]TPX31807.1 hypothetical protein SmJEL517_g04946 [Synchytrium microbalum]